MLYKACAVYPGSMNSHFEYGLGWMLWDDGLQGHAGGIAGDEAIIQYRAEDTTGINLFP